MFVFASTASAGGCGKKNSYNLTIHSLTASVRARSKRNGEFEHTIAAAVSHQRVKVKKPTNLCESSYAEFSCISCICCHPHPMDSVKSVNGTNGN